MSDLAYSVSADPGTGIRGPTSKGKEFGRMEGECLTSAKGIKGEGYCSTAQLAKFSGPTAANGRQYRQRHAASGPTLGRLNY